MSIIGQNVLTETVEYLDNGSIFDEVVTRKIAALNTATQSNVDLFIGATGRINLNVKGYNALRFQQKSDSDKTTQINLINNQGLEIISGDSSRTAIISDIAFTQSVTKNYLKGSKGVLVLDDDVEVTGSFTAAHDFLIGGAIVATSTNVMRQFSNNTSIGFGLRVDDTSNLELYKFDNSTNVTKRIFTFGIGHCEGIQDTNGFPIYGSSISNINSGIYPSANKSSTFWSSNGTDIYYNLGRIGVGTTTPLYTGHFAGTVYARDGFTDGYTTTNGAGSLTTTVLNAGAINTSNGSGINNITAQNITIGKLQTGVMPNIINTQEITTNKIDTGLLTCTGDIYFTGNIYRNRELLPYGGYWGYNSSGNFLYYSSGNVGIGTSNPKVSLDVYGTSAIKVPVGLTSQRPDSNIGSGMLRYNSTTQQFEGYGNSNWGSLGGLIDVGQTTYATAENFPGANNKQLRFFTSNIERMRIESNGIINVSSHILPTSNIAYDLGSSNFRFRDLYLSGNTINLGNTLISADSITSNITFTDKNNPTISRSLTAPTVNLVSGSYSGNLNITPTGNLSMFTNSIERLSVTNSGNLGIGVTNPSAKLQVIGDGNISTNLTVGGTLGITGLSTLSTLNVSGATNLVTSSGNVGIGTNAPAVKLHINSTDGIIIPVGTTAQRPTASTGMLRYNTTSSTFEGYGTTAWAGLGGVIDTAGTTFISAENFAGACNNELKFTTSNVQRMVVSSYGKLIIGGSNNRFDPYTTKLEVSGSNGIRGDLSIMGNFYQNDLLFKSSVFTTTNSNIYYNGHTYLQPSNYSISSNYNTSASSNITMGITGKFFDFTTISLPSNVPLVMYNNNILKSTGNVTFNLSGTVDGSTAYVSSGPCNLPEFTYTAAIGSNQAIRLFNNNYIAVLGY